MLFKVFVIYDDKARAYLPPWTLPEVPQAIRTFGDALADPNHDFSKHPEDYTLFQLGEFDSSSGVLVPEGTLLFVINGLELKSSVRRVAEQLALKMQSINSKEQA